MPTGDQRNLGHGPILPERVRVVFPAVQGGAGPACPGGASTTYLVSLGIDDVFAENSGDDPPVFYGTHPGHKRFRSSCPAVFDDPDDAEPANRDTLVALAKRIARDFYDWRLSRRHVTYPGTVAYLEGGDTDWVTFSYRPDLLETAVAPVPYDADPEDLAHGMLCDEDSSSSGGSGCPDRRQGSGQDDTFVWVRYPPGGIPPAIELSGGRIRPSSAECETYDLCEEDEIALTGKRRLVFNYWPGGAIRGDRLGTAKCWRGRLIAELEDCVNEGTSSSGV